MLLESSQLVPLIQNPLPTKLVKTTSKYIQPYHKYHVAPCVILKRKEVEAAVSLLLLLNVAIVDYLR